MATRITEHTGDGLGPKASASETEHRMPANLSAWLDHRAKLAAARAAAEGGEAADAG